MDIGQQGEFDWGWEKLWHFGNIFRNINIQTHKTSAHIANWITLKDYNNNNCIAMWSTSTIMYNINVAIKMLYYSKCP